ncbi:MAG TPA: extensin family protein [Xanthobacteraceae bacterium]|nr:extensin family protein [Xanthobacteraceae bacterium]
MSRSLRWSIAGSLVLVVLSGCGRTFFAEREVWRREAELQCLKSGAVKEGAGVVRVARIDGPGVCGAEFPLKVAAIGGQSALGFAEAPRPPGGIPRGALPAQAMPRWPVNDGSGYQPSAGYQQRDTMPAPAEGPAPLSLRPPAPSAAAPSDGEIAEASAPYDYRAPYRTPAEGAGGRVDPRAFDPAPARLGPASAPQYTGALLPTRVQPAATLACPMVSALDQWLATVVQPAALKWFGQQVVEIRQISSYSCRGMNGQPGARISEHAFGNALDVASFAFADGRKVTVKGGWRGLPEEQGFLRDVQGGACAQFATVLAPGSNVFHYDHIHVDLMRRNSGRAACNPKAVDGEVVAARARAQYARRGGEPLVTGSIRSARPAPATRLSRGYADQEVYEGLISAIAGED